MLRRSVCSRWLSVLLLTFVVACAPAAPPAPQPTAPPAKPGPPQADKPAEAAKPAEAKPAAPAAAPTTAPAKVEAKPAASPEARPAAAPAAKPRVSQEIVDGANREGQLKLLWTGTATDEWRQRFQDAFNAQYGVKVTITHTSSNNWGRDTSKLITEVSAGQKPSLDLMLISDSSYSDLHQAGLLTQHDWVGLFGVPARAVMFNGGAYSFAHQLVLPAYNRNLVKPADVPKTWDDFLDPKWKEKIGVSSGTHVWARLSQEWGDEKTTQYVQKLAAQSPRLGAFADLNQSLVLGEIHLMTHLIDNLMRVNQSKGAPVAWADEVQQMLAQALMAGPLKGAEHPNAALLFAGFLASEKGQALWLEFQGQTSIFAEGSPSWKMVQGKSPVVLREDFMARDLAPRTTKYGNMLGYR